MCTMKLIGELAMSRIAAFTISMLYVSSCKLRVKATRTFDRTV